MYYSPSLVKYPPTPSIRGNIPNENKILNFFFKQLFGKCQQSHVYGEIKVVYFYTKFVNRSPLNQRKIVLARNIGHVSDISLHVYHL